VAVATVSWEGLRDLARFRVEKGCAVSFYLGLDPSVAPTAGDAATRVNSLLDEAERSAGANRGELTHDQRLGLKSDFERIRAYFGTEFDRDGARGLAVFAAGLDNAWRTLALTEPVKDEVAVGREFHLAPLVPLIGRGNGAIVAVVGREQGQVYRLHGGKLHEIADLTEEGPRRHDQGGWSQANYQRHVDHLAAEHMRTVADAVDRLVRAEPHTGVVIVCADEYRREFADLLAQETTQALAGWTNAEAHATPAELLGVVMPVVEQWRTRQEAAVLERWRTEAARNGRAAAGWEATLEAASDGRVELLLFREGADREAWQCPKCGRAAAAPGNCPLDGTRLDEHEAAVDLAVHQTLAHGGSVLAVRRRQEPEPEPTEEICALLRY
jgi:peptide chain release factor subunit 1